LEQNKYLGIYIAADKTTVVLAAKTAGKTEIYDYFCILPENQQQQEPETAQAAKFTFADAAAKISTTCAEKHFTFSNVAVAVDCRLYRQQKLHTEFQEFRQIAQTIRFDAEEALAIDAAQSAIAFEVVGRQISGSDVTVFAAGTDIMTEIIRSLQGVKLDPVVIEPDSICLRRAIDDISKDAIVAAVSETRCFMVCPTGNDGKAIVRSFLTSPSQNKTSLLASQIMLTLSAQSAEGRTAVLKVYDLTGEIDVHSLTEQSSITVESLDIATKIALSQNESSNCEHLDLVIAAGAACVFSGKTEKVDFRADFMPYQGRKAAIEKILKYAGAAAAVVFLILGVFLQIRFHSAGRDIAKIEAKFKSEYTIAMPGARFPKTREAVRKLKSEINRIKDVKSGLLSASGEDSIETKLTLLFEAFNSVPKNIDINIDKITITTKTMNITGSTNLGGNLQLFSAFDKHPKLMKSSATYEPKDGRDNFRLTIELKQGRIE